MPGHAVDGVEVLQGAVVQLGAPQQRVEGGGHLLDLPGLCLGLHRDQVRPVQPRPGPVQVSADRDTCGISRPGALELLGSY